MKQFYHQENDKNFMEVKQIFTFSNKFTINLTCAQNGNIVAILLFNPIQQCKEWATLEIYSFKNDKKNQESREQFIQTHKVTDLDLSIYSLNLSFSSNSFYFYLNGVSNDGDPFLIIIPISEKNFDKQPLTQSQQNLLNCVQYQAFNEGKFNELYKKSKNLYDYVNSLNNFQPFKSLIPYIQFYHINKIVVIIYIAYNQLNVCYKNKNSFETIIQTYRSQQCNQSYVNYQMKILENYKTVYDFESQFQLIKVQGEIHQLIYLPKLKLIRKFRQKFTQVINKNKDIYLIFKSNNGDMIKVSLINFKITNLLNIKTNYVIYHPLCNSNHYKIQPNLLVLDISLEKEQKVNITLLE